MRSRLVAYVVGSLLCLGAPAIVEAKRPPGRQKSQTVDQEVEQLAEDAVAAYQEGRYERAIELFSRAYAIRPLTPLLYNLAKSYDKLGDVEKAYETYEKYADSGEADGKLEVKARERMGALESAYREKKDAATRPPEREAAPAATEPSPEQAAAAEAERLAREEVERKAKAEDATRRTHKRDLIIAASGAGAGVVVMVIGAGLYGAAAAKQRDFAASRDEDVKRELRDDARSLAGGSTALYVIGGLAIAGSGWFWYRWITRELKERRGTSTAPTAAPPAASRLVPRAVAPWFGAGAAGGVASWTF